MREREREREFNTDYWYIRIIETYTLEAVIASKDSEFHVISIGFLLTK